MAPKPLQLAISRYQSLGGRAAARKMGVSRGRSTGPAESRTASADVTADMERTTPRRKRVRRVVVQLLLSAPIQRVHRILRPGQVLHRIAIADSL